MAKQKAKPKGSCGGCLGLIVFFGLLAFVIAAVAGSSSKSTSTPEAAPPATEAATPETTSAPEPSNTPAASSEGEDTVGSASHAGDAQFCSEHHCEGDFTGEDGTVVECGDGDYSHAGGISGACSFHGGVKRE
jgi:hypothetical protein